MASLAAALASGAGSGCSEFNMVPRCDAMGAGVAVALIPNSLVPPGQQIDKARVASIVTVGDLTEIDSGYNRRTCRGMIKLANSSDQYEATFRLDQAEGAQNWQVISFLDHGKPEFDHLVAEVQQAYVQEER